MANTIEELKESIPFTEEELWNIEHGSDVDIWLEVKDISETVSAEDKALVDAKLGTGKVGLYLDVSMFKQVGEEAAVKLTKLDGKVKVSFVVMDALINTNADVTRTYQIIRVHDGVAEVIDTKFDAKTNVLSFETDHFSTYALTYTDVEVEKPASPTTGDSNNFVLWCTILVVCGSCILGTVIYGKKKARMKF